MPVRGSSKSTRGGSGTGHGVATQSGIIELIGGDYLEKKTKVNLVQLSREIQKVHDKFQSDLQANNALILQISQELTSLADQKEELDRQVEDALARRNKALQVRRQLCSTLDEQISSTSKRYFLDLP